ncbi:MAG: BMC domain-containing protein [Peptococcaceae bacterium]|nr:BMC domain-containing protein [Peptococcaceae bacterium]
MKALGLIELMGYCPTVVALDTALKTADVSFEQIHKIDKGMVSLSITGDVAAVTAAIDAAAAAAGQVGEVLYTHVIARPHDEVDCTLVVPKKAAKAPAPQPPSESSNEEADAEEEEPQEESDEEDPAEEAEEQNAELKTQAGTLTPEVLSGMTVKELRSVARDLNITNMTRKEIRFGKKEDLIASICKYLEQEC